jgi:sigma54-dependent transcription regulator
MPDLSGRELVGEWRKVMDSLLASATSAGGGAVPRQVLEPMQRQLELVQEVIERERRLQKQIAERLLAPVDAVFGLLEESGVTLRRQAEALEAAGRALEDTARLVKTQAELFERTIGILREPTERAKTAAGLERSVRRTTTKRGRPGRAAKR